MAIASTLPAEGLPSTAICSKELSPSVHAALKKAAHLRENFVWRKVIKPSDLRKEMNLREARLLRKFMRDYFEKAAIRIWNSEDRVERSRDWNTWIGSMRAALLEDRPELASEFYESGGAL